MSRLHRLFSLLKNIFFHQRYQRSGQLRFHRIYVSRRAHISLCIHFNGQLGTVTNVKIENLHIFLRYFLLTSMDISVHSSRIWQCLVIVLYVSLALQRL